MAYNIDVREVTLISRTSFYVHEMRWLIDDNRRNHTIIDHNRL